MGRRPQNVSPLSQRKPAIENPKSEELFREIMLILARAKEDICREANYRTLKILDPNTSTKDKNDLEISFGYYVEEINVKYENLIPDDLEDMLNEFDYKEVIEFIEVINNISYNEDIGLNYIAERLKNGDKSLRFLSLDERLKKLERFAIENSGHGVADFARLILPELGQTISDDPLGQPQPVASPDQTVGNVEEILNDFPSRKAHRPGTTIEQPKADGSAVRPTEAPVLWKDREAGETPPDFIRRVYAPWMSGGNGISKRSLRTLDPTLITELNKWVREGNELPADINILTVKSENDQLLTAGETAIREHLGKFTGAEALREAARLNAAQTRRK
jgi:hypothetical protein